MINKDLNYKINDVREFLNSCIEKSTEDVRIYSGLAELFPITDKISVELSYQDLLELAQKYNNILLCINELLKRI